MLEFIIENTFKALRPKNKDLKIPELTNEAIQTVSSFIEEINREEFKGGS